MRQYIKRDTEYWAKLGGGAAAVVMQQEPIVTGEDDTTPLDSHALVLSVPDHGAITDALADVYSGLDSSTIRACETRRIGISFAPVAMLAEVRELLAPKRLFTRWLIAAGYRPNTVFVALARYERMQSERGRQLLTEKRVRDGERKKLYHVKPSDIARRGWHSLSLTLQSIFFEEAFNGGFQLWVARQQDAAVLRTRCLRLAALLLETAQQTTVESSVAE